LKEESDFIAVRIPKSLKSKIEAIAESEGTTISDLVRVALDAFLRKVADFTPMGTIQLQKTMLATYLELMIEHLHTRLVLYAILNELRKDLSPEIKEVFDETKKAIRRYNEALDRLSKGDWEGALKLLSREGEG
jgi:antitoxin component of RelBE/YafQ-DinJ toxin-antitoxin module